MRRSPRACFQFSETLPKRTDYSPFVSVAGQDKPALSVDDQQICVEGLKHGESYAITLRAGLPSTVGEDLLKDAVFNIYVRDRSPSVRLSGKAYVLPRTGQQGIPLITVNTDLIKVTIYRIGDRSLIDNVLSWEFQRNLYSYSLDEIADQKGEKVWTGELKVERELNQEITTAFPIMDAVPTLEPGIYLLGGAARQCAGRRLRRAHHPVVHRLRSRADGVLRHRRHPRLCQFAGEHGAAGQCRDPSVGAQQRCPRGQEDRRQRRGRLRAWAGARRRRPVAGAADRLGRRRRLRVPQSQAIGVRSDRPRRRRARRAARARCVRVHRARRLPHRRDRLRDDIAARCCRSRRSRRGLDHGGGPSRRGRVPPQRGAGPGHRRPLARRADHLVGADRDLAGRGLFRSRKAPPSAK